MIPPCGASASEMASAVAFVRWSTSAQMKILSGVTPRDSSRARSVVHWRDISDEPRVVRCPALTGHLGQGLALHSASLAAGCVGLRTPCRESTTSFSSTLFSAAYPRVGARAAKSSKKMVMIFMAYILKRGILLLSILSIVKRDFHTYKV